MGLKQGYGLLGSSSLVIGAVLAYLIKLPKRITAGIMAFGCGVMISAVAYDLIMDGYEQGGIWPVIGGALAGSAAYTLANWLASNRGGKHRKRSGDQQSREKNSGGNGLAIAVGSPLDGIPESIILGVGLLGGGRVSLAMLAAVFLSNFPEGLSSAVGMRNADHRKAYVLGIWGGIALVTALASLLGAVLLGNASPWHLAWINAVAAGARLTMIVDTMIPEAVEGDGGVTGAVVVIGLLAAFAISQSNGG